MRASDQVHDVKAARRAVAARSALASCPPLAAESPPGVCAAPPNLRAIDICMQTNYAMPAVPPDGPRTTRGAAIGHVSPESAEGGPIGLLRDGDMIKIDIPGKRLDAEIADDELARRKASWKAPEPQIKDGYLARYGRLVSSAGKGAVVK